MITSGPRDLSGKRYLIGSASSTSLQPIQINPQTKSLPFVTIRPAVSYSKSIPTAIETGVPTFTWPQIVSTGPGHPQSLQTLSEIFISKMDQASHTRSGTKSHENANTSVVPIITNNANKVSLPPFLVMARHGQKYAIGQATLPSISTLGFAMKPLALSKEVTETDTIASRPLPIENTIQVDHARINNDVIANYPGPGCLTRISFGPTQNLPAIIINRDMSELGQSRAQMHPNRAGMATSLSPLRT